ncbi:MAG: hypothetical protein NZM11_00725 [Anaerolineales bacterium]|nr:hypothetical protein [Anaerolineales bacterium]
MSVLYRFMLQVREQVIERGVRGPGEVEQALTDSTSQTVLRQLVYGCLVCR